MYIKCSHVQQNKVNTLRLHFTSLGIKGKKWYVYAIDMHYFLVTEDNIHTYTY